TRKEDVRDPIGITGWPKEKGRDGERTPMQWTPGPQAGFSINPQTWLPIAPDYKTVNVESESADPGSLLNWYRRLIQLRRVNPALRDGEMVMIHKNDPHVLSFVRRTKDGHAVVVAVNMSNEARTITLDLKEAGIEKGMVKTIAASDSLPESVSLSSSITLPLFASWIGSVDLR
ncbi:MAG: DUF3459 domain-containing protein, partial [Acidobacteriaceae bacterium]|nr:DUF3459 domain-containing protein [Acidobacteriaceae bacterium]